MARLDLLQSFLGFVNELVKADNTMSEDEFYGSFYGLFKERLRASEVGTVFKDLVANSGKSNEVGELVISFRQLGEAVFIYPIRVPEDTIHNHVLYRYLHDKELYLSNFEEGDVDEIKSRTVVKLSDDQNSAIMFMGSTLIPGLDDKAFVGFYFYCIGLPTLDFYPHGNFCGRVN